MQETEVITALSSEGAQCSEARFMVRKDTFDKGIIGEAWHGLFYTKHPMFSIKPGDIAVDIGAHIGAFAVLAATKGAVVYAFEPEDNNFSLLMEQKMLNPDLSKWIIAEKLAVTGDGRAVKLIMCSDPANTGGNWTERQEGNPEGAQSVVEVPSTTLSKIVEGLERVDFLKMDCEGAEYEILMQAGQETLGKVAKIAMEWHGGREQFDGLRDFLKLAGFENEAFDGNQDMGSAFFWR